MTILNVVGSLRYSLNTKCPRCPPVSVVFSKCLYSEDLESKYSVVQREKILKVINESDVDDLARYSVTKGRLKKLSQWRNSNGKIETIADLEYVEGFSEKYAQKLFDSILDGPGEKIEKVSNGIKGQILQPTLSESIRKKCGTVLAVYTTAGSISWTLFERSSYELLQWEYHSIDYPDGKRLQLTDILDTAWRVTRTMPRADVYAMRAEATTLRAAGSDPNNPKVLAVNLQKAQMVAMIVALINARDNRESTEEGETNTFQQKVYFLRSSLPFRLYGTLVGNEKVSTDQTIEMILQNINGVSQDNRHVYINDSLKAHFRSQKDLEKDMLGHCLLLGLTFMDLCIYKNQDSINKLTRRSD